MAPQERSCPAEKKAGIASLATFLIGEKVTETSTASGVPRAKHAQQDIPLVFTLPWRPGNGTSWRASAASTVTCTASAFRRDDKIGTVVPPRPATRYQTAAQSMATETIKEDLVLPAKIMAVENFIDGEKVVDKENGMADPAPV